MMQDSIDKTPPVARHFQTRLWYVRCSPFSWLLSVYRNGTALFEILDQGVTCVVTKAERQQILAGVRFAKDSPRIGEPPMSSESDLAALIAAIYEAGMDFSLW